MKIGVIIPSRRHPKRLQAVIQALHATRSGQNEVVYTVSYCSDDRETREAVFSLPAEINAKPVPRTDHCTPGQAFNEAWAATPGLDAVMGWCDDVFPLSWCWDIYVAAALKDLPAACWIEAGDAVNTSYIFARQSVVKAIGNPCPTLYPYWFNDLHFAEVFHFAFGERPRRVSNLICGGQRGETQGHHECLFWAQVFEHTRPERIEMGAKLAASMCLMPPPVEPILQVCRLWDIDFQSKAEAHDKRFGDQRHKEAFYERAKARAIAMLAGKAA